MTCPHPSLSSGVATAVFTEEKQQPGSTAHAVPLPLPMHMAITSEFDLIEEIPRLVPDTSPAAFTPTSTCTRPPLSQSTSRYASSRAKPYEYRCRCCHRTFPHRSRIVEHVRKHSPQLKLPCTSCDTKFTSASTLARHIRLHHQTTPTPTPTPTTQLQLQSKPQTYAPSPSTAAATSTTTAATATTTTAAAAAASVPVPVSWSSSSSSSVCVPFDVVDVVQVYPSPGRQLCHVNSIVYTGIVKRSDCLPHLNGQRVVYKSINPAQNSQRAVCGLQHEFKMHETLRSERFYVREALAMLGTMMIMKHGGTQTLDEFIHNKRSQLLLQQHLRRAAYEIFACIHACHKHQIVHRDLKPSNFMVKNDTAEYFHLMIIDLGLACHIDDSVNCARDTEFNHIKQRLRQAKREAGLQPETKRAEADGDTARATADINSKHNKISYPPVNVGTRGYRGPHLLLTHRCDYTDDLWVGALIVFEMATTSSVYRLFELAQPEDVSSSKQKLAARVSEAVIQRRYVPWKLLLETHPYLTSFLRRVMREEQPYFNTAAEILQFIQNKDNDIVFQFQQNNTRKDNHKNKDKDKDSASDMEHKQ